MRHSRAWLVLVGLVAIVGLFALGAAGASADVTLQHGIGLSKGCISPTKIDDPYTCSYTIRNILDDANDTLTINQLIDTVNASGGPAISGNILNLADVTITTTPTGTTPSGATCAAASGNGISPTPYEGVTSCTLPAGSRVNVLPFSDYTVQPGDWNLPGHILTDSVSLQWHDLCDGTPTSNCNANPPNVGAASQSTLLQLDSSTATDIHNAAHEVVTSVAVGTTVHDFVTVTGQPGHPNPSGNVSIDWFLNGTCDGAAAANSGPLGPLEGSGQLDATGFSQTVNSPGMYAFRATYLGDNRYSGSTGPCEPLQVFQPDANILLTPATATNAVGTNHTLHCHVNVSDDSVTYGNAPDGTVCTVSIISGRGTPVSQNCTMSGGTGTCDVVITSSTVGTSVVQATTTLTVNTVVLTRTTGDANVGDGPNAQKVWVDANIQISPPTATNAVGTNHVLTITVNAINGTIDAGPHTATASIVSGPGGFVGSPSCTYTGGGASASCTVTISSAATGTTVVQATSNIPVSGQVISRTTATNPGPGGSDNASKVWVDANINISPSTANNPVGSNHVLTITVNALNGTIDAGPHTATASIVSGPGGFVGSPSCTYTGGGASASCTVTISSAATGTTVVSATSNIPVSGTTITRTTGTAVNTASGGSGNASKNWADSTVRTDVHDAAHNVITSVNAGAIVHDKVFVAKAAGTSAGVPNPTGNVTFNLYVGLNCSGNATSQTVAIAADGTAESSTTTATADLSYQAVYAGDANYPGHTGACEPLHVIVQQGQITPTQVDCTLFASGTAPTQTDIFYKASGGLIGQSINPGVF